MTLHGQYALCFKICHSEPTKDILSEQTYIISEDVAQMPQTLPQSNYCCTTQSPCNRTTFLCHLHKSV